uniref:Uncharacterized protein n=1 Tax=Romanomermis culicivorax TaxID=13658 RepID=A0A915KKJ6_ROMCU
MTELEFNIELFQNLLCSMPERFRQLKILECLIGDSHRFYRIAGDYCRFLGFYWRSSPNLTR